MVYPALLPLIRTTLLPVVEWTDAPADLNGLLRFVERRNLVSAHVLSHFNWPLPPDLRTGTGNNTLSVEVMNEWVYYSALPVCLNGVYRYSSTCYWPNRIVCWKNKINQVGCKEVLYESMDWGYFSENIGQWRAIVSTVKRVGFQRNEGFL